MTTFAIIAGLIPTAFGRGAGSAQLRHRRHDHRRAIVLSTPDAVVDAGRLWLLDRWAKALRGRQWSWKALFKASEKPNE